MTREAFDLSERFRVPVMMRLVTRLAHSARRSCSRASRAPENPMHEARGRDGWILLPANARRQWTRTARPAGSEMRAWQRGVAAATGSR